ncbi:hypothetical protein ACWDE9_04530 [Streptomyces olivaceoviridis]
MDEYARLYNGMAFTRRGEMPDLPWSAWNQALIEVSFLCTKPVVEVAYALDETLWRADWEIRGGRTGQDAWLTLRRPVDSARSDLIHAVRSQTSPRLRGSVRTLGRPADDDPMWASQQSGKQRLIGFVWPPAWPARDAKGLFTITRTGP